MPEHGAPPPHAGPRRTATARGAFAVGLLGYAVAALLNAPSLAALAARQELGPRRTWALRAVNPLVKASEWTRLDRAHRALNRALHPPESAPAPAASLSLDDPPPVAPSVAPVAPSVAPHDVPDAHDARGRALTEPACMPIPARRLRVFVAGDSMAGAFGRAFVTLANQTSTLRAGYESRHSTGLTRPDLFDWPARIEEIHAQQRPDVTVLVFGANDTQRLMYRDRPVSVESPEWAAAYASRVARVMTAATAGGRRALWVGLPAMRLESFSRHVRALDEIFRAEASRHPGVTFVDTWDRAGGPGGAYAAYLPDETGSLFLAREPDGVHFTREYAARLAREVLRMVPRRCEGPSPPG